MIHIDNKADCCGCGACTISCPQKCITMVNDTEGFLYPVVDQEKCVNCKICERVCPISNRAYTSQRFSLPKGYIAYCKNANVRLNSSSGGIFSVLADYIFSENGYVFGAAFDENFNVHHICISSTKNIELLRGSKYVQSTTESTFYEVKQLLDLNQKVLYSGTACQIAGLNSYLGKRYTNLITIDILCHGVPSPLVWYRYIHEQEKKHNSILKSIVFRSKRTGWKSYSVLYRFQDGKETSRKFRRDPYMQLFLSNICLRPSCHKCAFKNLQRCSDITIGDAWGVERYHPDMDDDKGTSIILLHTEIGENLFHIIEHNLVYHEADVEKILPPWSDARKSVVPHKDRKIFFQKINGGKKVLSLSRLVRPSVFTRVYYRIMREIKK